VPSAMQTYDHNTHKRASALCKYPITYVSFGICKWLGNRVAPCLNDDYGTVMVERARKSTYMIIETLQGVTYWAVVEYLDRLGGPFREAREHSISKPQSLPLGSSVCLDDVPTHRSISISSTRARRHQEDCCLAQE
jgi:hypothetical protein